MSSTASVFASIPEALKAIPAWMIWRAQPDGDKVKKIPVDLKTGRATDHLDQENWASFEEAVSAVGAHGSSGLGFVLDPSHGVVAVDLDKCLSDGTLSDEAFRILEQLFSYSEVSPRGKGLHILVRASLPSRVWRRDLPESQRLEIFSGGQFITVTGDALPQLPSVPEDRQEEVEALLDEFFPWWREEFSPETLTGGFGRGTVQTDENILGLAKSGVNGSRFLSLFEGGQTNAYGNDDSRADAALAGFFAVHTDDPEQIERLMSRSALVRSKWEERRGSQSYLQVTIQNVLSSWRNGRAFAHGGGDYSLSYPLEIGTGEKRPPEVERDSLLLPTPERGRKEEFPTSNDNVPPPRELEASSLLSAGRSLGEARNPANDNAVRFPFRSMSELMADVPDLEFLVEDYLPRESLVELVGKIKDAGKTTFALALIKAVVSGEPFLGKRTEKGKVVVLSEMAPRTLKQMSLRAGLCESDPVRVLSYTELKGGATWEDIVAAAGRECKSFKADLLVIDTLSRFANLEGDQENQAGRCNEVMAPLQRATTNGPTILLLRHGRKSGGGVSDSGRGSSAISGAMDVVLNLTLPEKNSDPRVRNLSGRSRLSDLSDVKIRLNEDGKYSILDNDRGSVERERRDHIRELLPCGLSNALTYKDIEGRLNYDQTSLRESLNRMVEAGELQRSGTGRRNSPFTYWREEEEVEKSA